MRTITAVLLGKCIAYFSRLLKYGGGSAAPGLYALKVDPDLVANLAKKIPQNIVITGTNGKTTTSRMIAHFAKSAGLKVIRNHTGSNLERGITSALISNSHLTSGKLDFDLGIWELDEAAFNIVTPKLNPAAVVVLNVSRDQLDRYGEVDKVVNDWCQTVQKLPKNTVLLINSNDKGLEKLSESFKGKIIRFKLPRDVKQNGLTSSKFSLIINHQSLIVNLPLPGVYHIYDAVAALTVAKELNFPMNKCIQSLKSFHPAFGRMEKLTITPSGCKAYISLIKNPAGATAVLETLSPLLKPDDRLLLALNDNLADGTDVSWIWDAEFEELRTTTPRLRSGQAYNLQPICSGTRAYDLANRLKYAGITATTEPDLKKAFKDVLRGLKGRLFILPTYTAMLSLQKILRKQGVKPNYWEEKN